MRNLTADEFFQCLQEDGTSLDELCQSLVHDRPEDIIWGKHYIKHITLDKIDKHFTVVFDIIQGYGEDNLIASVYSVAEMDTGEYLDFLWREDHEFRRAYLRMVKMTKY